MDGTPADGAPQSALDAIARRWWLAPLLLIACLLPVIASPHQFRGDETRYTDAALTMIERGDYVTPRIWNEAHPRAWDDELRFRKPIVSYWLVVAGLAIARDSFLGARLGFLLC